MTDKANTTKTTISDLVSMGKEIRKNRVQPSYIDYIFGKEYETWRTMCIIYLLRKNYNKEFTSQFLKTANNPYAGFLSNFDKMLSILEAFEAMGEEQEVISYD